MTIETRVRNSGLQGAPGLATPISVSNGGTGSSSFTAGSVIFSNGTILTQDNPNFFWDDTNNWLGIGTASPETNLHLFEGTAAAVTTFPNSLLTLENSTHAYINLLVPSGSAAGLIIGQGTTANYTALTFNRVVADVWDISSATAGFTSALYIRNSDNTDANSSANLTVFVGGANSGDPYMLYTVSTVITWSWGVDNSDSDKFKLSTGGLPGSGDVFTITTTGLVGIGTSTPQGRLDITTAATNDDVNYWYQQARVATTDATQTTLDTFAITASRTYVMEARVVARRTGGAAGTADDGAAYVIRAAYTTKAGTVTLLGLVNADYTAEDQILFEATFTISGTNVLLSVTGVVSNNVVWHSTTKVSWVGT